MHRPACEAKRQVCNPRHTARVSRSDPRSSGWRSTSGGQRAASRRPAWPASPPPAWNFAVLPKVSEVDAYWSWKQGANPARQQAQTRDYTAIEVPRNSPTGFVTAFFAVVTGFALIWHIWWMAALGAIGAFATLLAFAFRDQEEIEIPAAQLARFDQAHQVEIAG